MTNENNRTPRTTKKSNGKFFESVFGIVAKSNLIMKARVNEPAQINKSMNNIDHLGKLYFQKSLNN